MPGIDSAHMAMDTEEGVEVVWNEVCYSNRKLMKGSKASVPRPEVLSSQGSLVLTSTLPKTNTHCYMTGLWL